MRTPISRLLLSAAVLCGAVLASLVAPAAAQAGNTTVTFVVAGGALSISNPATAALGTGTPGVNLTGQLGAVTVTDARGLFIASWIATASTSTFLTGSGAAGETITAAGVAYASAVATSTSGVGVFTPGQLTVALAASLAAPKTAYALTAGLGVSAATWNPSIVITLPAAAVAGTYTGTITHSVA